MSRPVFGGIGNDVVLYKCGTGVLQLSIEELQHNLRKIEDLSETQKAHLAQRFGFQIAKDARTWRTIVIEDVDHKAAPDSTSNLVSDEDRSASKPFDRRKREEKSRREEEARICDKIAPLVQGLYSSISLPDVNEAVAFDVCSGRKGSVLQNVDILATQWFGPKEVEIIAIEVKLIFNAEAVMQAMSYSRFADRVWIAYPVRKSEDISCITKNLFLSTDAGLFDYAINQGIGVLAIPRVQNGGIKEVLPVSWPRRQQIDPLARRQFLERYKKDLIKAKVVRPDEYKEYVY